VASDTPKIRVLIADDSALIRQMMCDFLGQDPGIEVVAAVRDGQKALEAFDAARPDVVVLDIQMPNMDGLATLESLLAVRPVPVVMFSSLTQLGAQITLDALERGAMDYVAKPERGNELQTVMRDELAKRIRAVAGSNVRRILEIRRARKQRRVERVERPVTPKAVPELNASETADRCVAIGISTGGPPALTYLFERLQTPMPPIVIVQHMPPQFTKTLAWRLDSISPLSVKEAETGDLLCANRVLVAPGGQHMEVRRDGKRAKVVVFDGPPVSSHKPSIDVMMQSVAAVFGPRVLGVIMTGMGRDGADGCGAIRAAGGYVLGQDEASSDVYGMNKVAHREGHVDQQFHLNDAPDLLSRYSRNPRATRASARAPDLEAAQAR
jgi:two-component system, chemotaxis family, protein-glutamate methylesterase/glutaminase